MFELQKETLYCNYENSLESIKKDRKNYLEEKEKKLSQGKGIRINRKQQFDKWNKLKLTYFQNNLHIKMHPSQSDLLLDIVEKYYLNKIKSLYAEEDSPYDKIEAHEFFRQKPITFSNDDISFLEYEFSSKNEYALYINKHPYLVWMGKNKLVQRDESGKPIWNSAKTDLLYSYTDCFIIVQRLYNGFFWVVSSYEANDSRQDRKQQAVEDMMNMIGQESGAKTIEQIAKELHEYMWLTPIFICHNFER